MCDETLGRRDSSDRHHTVEELRLGDQLYARQNALVYCTVGSQRTAHLDLLTHADQLDEAQDAEDEERPARCPNPDGHEANELPEQQLHHSQYRFEHSY